MSLLLPLAAGCDLPGQPNPADRPVLPDKVLSFDALYRTNCAGCHGADGKLGPAPPLNDPLFRQIVPEEVVRQTLNEGRPGTPMMAFARDNGGMLTPAQIDVLVHEIKGVPYQVNGQEVTPKWGVPGPAPQGAPSYLPEQSASQAGDREHGLQLFARACADCHGAKGEGGDMAGAIHNPAFLALISPQELRRYVITGRPDLGMPAYADGNSRSSDFRPLTSGDVADLVALLESWKQNLPETQARARAPRPNP